MHARELRGTELVPGACPVKRCKGRVLNGVCHVADLILCFLKGIADLQALDPYMLRSCDRLEELAKQPEYRLDR